MIIIFLTRLLERVHFASLGVDARHDVLDGAILACRIHRLKNYQHRPAILGVKTLLQLRQQVDAFRQQLPGLFFVDVQSSSVRRITFGKSKLIRFVDTEAIDEIY